MNPMALQFLQMIKSGANPQQLIIQYLQKEMSNTPIGRNLLDMAQKGDSAGIEQVARNIMSSKGLDYDKEFNAFKKFIGR